MESDYEWVEGGKSSINASGLLPRIMAIRPVLTNSVIP
jgi:hypothetical protein